MSFGKKLSLIFILFLLYHSCISTRYVECSTDYIGEWCFDEEAGSIVTDQSEYGNNGQIHNADYVTGISGTALHFEGNDNSYVEIPNLPELTPETELYIEAYIKPESYPTWHSAIIYKGDLTQQDCFAERSYTVWAKDNGGIHFAFTLEGETCQRRFHSEAGLINLNQWNQIKIHLDTSSNLVEIIINGENSEVEEYDSPGSMDSRPIKSGNSPLRIGGMFRTCGDQSHFHGSIDEVKIYSSDNLNSQTSFEILSLPQINVPTSYANHNLDGYVNLKNEYKIAETLSISSPYGVAQFYLNHNDTFLRIAALLPDNSSQNEQLWIGFDLNNDENLDSNHDLWLLWHRNPSTNPDGETEPWTRYWEGDNKATTNTVGIYENTQIEENAQIEFLISKTYFQGQNFGFHIRYSPEYGNNYVWGYEGNVHNVIQDKDASKYQKIQLETLVAYWNFDSYEEIIDLSGNNNNLNLGNGITSRKPVITEGYYENGLLFDGIDDIILCESITELGTEGTIAFWVNLETDYRQAFIGWNTWTGEGPLEVSTGTERQLGFYLADNDQRIGECHIYNYPNITRQWNHITVTWETDKTMNLYLNGQLIKSNAYSGELASQGSNPFQIGYRDADWKLKGVIDEIWLYNRVLSSEEIYQLMETHYTHANQAYENNIIQENPEQNYFSSSNEQLILTSANGQLDWEKFYGGAGGEVPYSFIKTSNGDYIAIGETQSYPADTSNLYLVKTDNNGNLIWNLTYGQSYPDIGYDIIEHSNGYYYLTGGTTSYGEIGEDLLIMKISPNGNIIWQKTFNRNAWEWGTSIIETQDSGLISVGVNQAFWGDYYDIYILKIDSNGNKQWHKIHQMNFNQFPTKIIRSNDNAYIITGYTENIDDYRKNVFIMKIDPEGDLIWVKEYGGVGNDISESIVRSDDGYLITGSTPDENENEDILLLKIDEYGNQQWNKTFGTNNDESAEDIIRIGNQQYLLAGTSYQDTGKTSILIVDNLGNLIYQGMLNKTTYHNAKAILQNGTKITVLSKARNKGMDFSISQFTFNPYTIQTSTPYGNTIGSGTYYGGSNATITIESPIFNASQNVRYVFDGWECNKPIDINLNSTNISFPVTQDLSFNANYRRQVYIQISSSENGTIDQHSGWHNENSVLRLTAHPEAGMNFIEWQGTGEGSYTGIQPNITLTLTEPINQHAIFGKIQYYTLITTTECGVATGQGVYKQNEIVSISINPTIYPQSEYQRMIFKGWASENGYNGPNPTAEIEITQNITQKAIWEKQYLVIIKDNEELTQNKQEWYPEGSEITLYAPNKPNYNFEKWEGTGQGSYSGAEKTPTISVTAPITQTAIYTEKPGPNYKLFTIIGLFIAIPFISKTAIQLDYNSQKTKYAKKEYKGSRGTQHKQILETILTNLNKEIKEQEQKLRNLRTQRTNITTQKEQELERAVTTHVFNTTFQNIPGIGPTLKERIRHQSFNGTYDSLRSSWRVHGIGENKQYAIQNWINTNQANLPRALRNNFPNKQQINEKYARQIDNYNKKISQTSKKIEDLNRTKNPVETEYIRLKNVTVKTIKESFEGNQEAAEKVLTYHRGIYPEWGTPPKWLEEAEKYL
ncbi:MAG: LamG-like jellyroll fold domain-containing protein [Candidatus Hodarchaeales archaeon]